MPAIGALVGTILALGISVGFLVWRSGEQRRVLDDRTGRCVQGDRIACDQLQSACLKRSGDACVALADSRLAAGPSHDPDAGRRLLGEACEYRHREACLRGGRMSLEAEGARKDLPAARALLDRGCELGSHEACALRQTLP
jgi:hypothetical protein